ncbi:hypothetical protein CR513_32818, partial [Mucuna pruriens]
MGMLDNGEIESESSNDDGMPPLEDCSGVEVAEPINRDILVTRCALSIQPKEDGAMEQREHNFHTRCHINDKLCSMIIDSGSCTNVAMPLAIENYKEEVLCDMVLMEARHTFGPPMVARSQGDPEGQVCEDQIKMRKVREYEESIEKKNERTKEKSEQKNEKRKRKESYSK